MVLLFKKGELLLAYDESEIYTSELLFIKEIWDEDYKETHGEMTNEKVEKIVWSRLSDGWLSQHVWDEFTHEFTSLMRERNPSLKWESPDYHSKDDKYIMEDQKFNMDNGLEMLRKFVNFDRYGNLSFIKIFAYGKDGFCIDPEWQQEKCVLSACKSGFYRDWDHDGICVAAREGEYPD